MPPHPLLWRHVIINTKSSWLHGDPRGFRDRDHRIHSTGDYKDPPPPGEHARLHRYMQSRAGAPVAFPPELRPRILRALVERLQGLGYDVRAGSVGEMHAHVLVNLPEEPRAARKVIGLCKRSACEAVKRELPGSLWAADGEFKPVRTKSHWDRVFSYITEKQEPDAATWSAVDGVYRPGRSDPGRRH